MGMQGLSARFNAVLKSSNCGFVRLGLRTGLDNVVEVSNRLLGRDSENSFRPPVDVLGCAEVTPLEQAVAYGLLRMGGCAWSRCFMAK